MTWQKTYLATCIVLADPGAAMALGPASYEDAKRDLELDSDSSKQTRARRLAEAIQSTLRDLEQMERRWDA